MPRPPITMKGDVRVTTIATCHEKIKQKAHEKKIPKKASVTIPTLSVVSPFTYWMSSLMILLR